MDQNEIAIEFPPLIRVYKDGRVERLLGTATIPPQNDAETGVQCKDTIVSPENNLSARLFIPKPTGDQPQKKLPLVIYIHGGAFCVQSPFSPTYYGHLVSLVNAGELVVVTIQYRRAPEHFLPVAYDDSWEAIKWVGSHVGRNGPEPWINGLVNFDRVFIAGEASGANIAHTMGIRAGLDGLPNGLNLIGLVLVDPYFVDEKEAHPKTKFLDYIYPSKQGWADPRINPVGAGPEHLAGLGCSKVLVCVASEDVMVGDSGVKYYEGLKRSGWGGKLDIFVSEGEGHIFHLRNPKCDKAQALVSHIVSFIHKL